jgi:hypothetical protein
MTRATFTRTVTPSNAYAPLRRGRRTGGSRPTNTRCCSRAVPVRHGASTQRGGYNDWIGRACVIHLYRRKEVDIYLCFWLKASVVSFNS